MMKHIFAMHPSMGPLVLQRGEALIVEVRRTDGSVLVSTAFLPDHLEPDGTRLFWGIKEIER